MIIIDFFSNEVINLKPGISGTLKEKIFASNKMYISPNLLALGDGVKYITNSEAERGLNRVIVYYLIPEITEYVLKNSKKFIELDPFLINGMYKSLKNIYTELTLPEFELCIQYVLSKHIFSDLDTNQDIKQWIKQNELLRVQKSVVRPRSSPPLIQNMLYIESGKYVYSIINSVILFKIAETPLDLLKIIREYDLSENVPVMATNEDKRVVVKALKDFPKTQVKKWFLDDKRVKGLTIKLKTVKDVYSTSILSKFTPNINIRCSWVRDLNARIDAVNSCINSLNEFVNQVKAIFPNKDIGLRDKKISFITFQFNTKKKVSFSKILLTVPDFPEFILDEQPRKKEFIKLEYKGNTVIIKYTPTSNNVEVIGVKTEEEIFDSMNSIGNLLSAALSKKVFTEFKNFEFVEGSATSASSASSASSAQVTEKKKNIKALRKKGIVVDVVGCQKARQPQILDSIPSSPEKNVLIYKDVAFVCPNPPYTFPGFTNKNVLCCFKKDQTNKVVFKRNMGTGRVNVLMSDEVILSQPVITTKKKLEINRLGVIFPKTLFGEKFLRLGVSRNTIESCLVKAESSERNTNIIVFNIINKRFVCKENLFMPHDNFVFIIKNEDNYELIVYRESSKKLKKQFKKTDTISQKIMTIYTRSCVVKYSGPGVPPPTMLEVYQSGVEVKSQIVNAFGKAVYLNTSKGITPIIPTQPSPVLSRGDFIKLKADTQAQYTKPTGQILSNGRVVALITESSLIVPTKVSEQIPDTPIVFRQHVKEIDDLLFYGTPTTDERFSYMLVKKFNTELYERFKFIFSRVNKTKINVDAKTINDVMINQVSFGVLPPSDIPVIRNICSELNTSECSLDALCSVDSRSRCRLTIPQELYNPFIKKLLIEIKINKDILKGTVKREFLDKNLFVKRKNEIVLLTDDDIKEYLKN